MKPENISVTDDQTELLVQWSGDQTDRIAAPHLREYARDAASIRQRIENGSISPDSRLQITQVAPVGAMGVNIAFSDGHDRAIYPWCYLRELAAPQGN